MAVTSLRRAPRATLALAAFLAAVPALPAQGGVTPPKTQFGWNIGDDYRLVTYTQLSDYWKSWTPNRTGCGCNPSGRAPRVATSG